MSNASPATVLVVDDEPEVLDFLGHCLRAHGYGVIEAQDGSGALTAARHFDGPIDLLLTDIKLPGMQGPELARRLSVQRPGAKVLFISGYCHLELPSPCEFLQKPFTVRVLIEKVNRILEAKDAVEAAHAGRG